MDYSTLISDEKDKKKEIRILLRPGQNPGKGWRKAKEQPQCGGMEERDPDVLWVKRT